LVRAFHIIFFLATGCAVAFGQFTYEEDHRHVNFAASYMAVIDLPSDHDVFQHGMSFSASPSLVNKYRIRQQEKTGFNRIIDRHVYMNAAVSWYKREDLHHALMVQAGPAFRITLPEGIFFDFSGSIGYMRTFLSGDHFTFDGNTVSETRALGSDLFVFSAEASAGWDFYKSHQYPVFLFAAAGLMTYFPNNGSWVYQPVFRGGLGFVLMRLNQSY
jgi:hypothetical protein